MLKPFVHVALCAGAWAALLNTASAQAPLPSRTVVQLLETPTDVVDVQNPMTLKDVLGLLHDKLRARGIVPPEVAPAVLVDQAAFRAEKVEGDVYETQVRFPPFQGKLSAAALLDLAVSAIEVPSTYVVRQGRIDILPAKQATLNQLLKMKVLAQYDDIPLSQVLQELADWSGVSIQVDSRTKERRAFKVTATFRNDTSLRDVVLMLADMAELKVVELPSAIYVTTAANAESLTKELQAKPAPRTK